MDALVEIDNMRNILRISVFKTKLDVLSRDEDKWLRSRTKSMLSFPEHIAKTCGSFSSSHLLLTRKD